MRQYGPSARSATQTLPAATTTSPPQRQAESPPRWRLGGASSAEIVAGKRHIADVVLPRSSSLADLNNDQLRLALGLRPDELLGDDQ